MTQIPIIESYWLEEDLFLAGEYPGGYDPESARRRMDAFLEAGIRTFGYDVRVIDADGNPVQ